MIKDKIKGSRGEWVDGTDTVTACSTLAKAGLYAVMILSEWSLADGMFNNGFLHNRCYV